MELRWLCGTSLETTAGGGVGTGKEKGSTLWERLTLALVRPFADLGRVTCMATMLGCQVKTSVLPELLKNSGGAMAIAPQDALLRGENVLFGFCIVRCFRANVAVHFQLRACQHHSARLPSDPKHPKACFRL